MAAQPYLAPPKKPLHRHASGRGIVRVSANAADALDNPESIKEWDDEELRRGRRRDKNGRFTGRDPNMIPTNVLREIVRREIKRAEKTIAENLQKGVEALTAIAISPRAEDRDKLAAIKIMMDRCMGKVPDKIETTGTTPLFVTILQGGIVPGAALEVADDNFIDAESEELTWDE